MFLHEQHQIQHLFQPKFFCFISFFSKHTIIKFHCFFYYFDCHYYIDNINCIGSTIIFSDINTLSSVYSICCVCHNRGCCQS